MQLKLNVTPSKILLGISFLMIAGYAIAGSLEPPGPPGPTMKTLDEIPPSWHQILPAAQRFQSVLGDKGVLDKETGLVWEKQPQISKMNWSDALDYCYRSASLGKPRGGWRLPTIEDLSSLFDTSQIPASIPAGVFVGISGFYWTSTTDPKDASNAYPIDSGSGSVFPQAKTNAAVAVPWCVRGGSGHSS